MSGRHVGIVFRFSRHDSSELLVLACIAEALNDKTGTWYMSVAQIAKRCKLSDRHVFRILPKLRESNELGMRKGGPQGQNVFWLKLQPPVSAPSNDANEAATMTQVSEADGVTATSSLQQVPRFGMTAASDLNTVKPTLRLPSETHRADEADMAVTAKVTSSTGGHDTPVTSSMTAVTPITRHSEKNTTPSSAEPQAVDGAEEVAWQLRDGGVENVKVTKQFREAVNLGASAASLMEAMAESVHAGNPFAYGVIRVLNSLKADGQRDPKVAAPSIPSPNRIVYTEDPALQKITRDAGLAVPVPTFVRELSRKLRGGVE